MAALTEEQYTRGVVIDGLSSQYLSPELAANLLLASMGLQKTCKFVVLSAISTTALTSVNFSNLQWEYSHLCWHADMPYVLFMHMQLKLYVHICMRT